MFFPLRGRLATQAHEPGNRRTRNAGCGSGGDSQQPSQQGDFPGSGGFLSGLHTRRPAAFRPGPWLLGTASTGFRGWPPKNSGKAPAATAGNLTPLSAAQPPPPGPIYTLQTLPVTLTVPVGGTDYCPHDQDEGAETQGRQATSTVTRPVSAGPPISHTPSLSGPQERTD